MDGGKAGNASSKDAVDSVANGEANAQKDVQEDRNDASKGSSSPGKIFIGGLSRDTTSETFTAHFRKYGALTDSVIMKDRSTGYPRGFGFVTYADPSVVDKVIKDKHVLDGRTVEIKRTIPRGNATSKGPKTKKIFVGGIPISITEDEFKGYFSKYGKVVEHQIMQDRESGRSRGFGFITFDNEQAVEDILAQGKMCELGGKQVEIKKAEPKKPIPDPVPGYGNDYRPPYIAGGRGGYGDIYSGLGGGGGYDVPPYRSGGFGARPGGYGGYGSGDYGSDYGAYGGSGLGGYQGGSGGFGGRTESYGGGFGGYGSGVLSGYGADREGFTGYGGSSYAGGYDSGLGGRYGGGGAYGSGRGAYSGSSNGRYHPYAR